MKRIFASAVVLLVAAGALYFAQRRTRHDAVSTNAIVNLAADWERDVSRVPMHFTRLSDAEETQIGDELARQYTSESTPPRQRRTVPWSNTSMWLATK